MSNGLRVVLYSVALLLFIAACLGELWEHRKITTLSLFFAGMSCVDYVWLKDAP